jgi:hypothetical protein
MEGRIVCGHGLSLLLLLLLFCIRHFLCFMYLVEIVQKVSAVLNKVVIFCINLFSITSNLIATVTPKDRDLRLVKMRCV